MERKRLGSRHIWKLELTGLVADGKLRIRAASVDEAKASRLYTRTGSRKTIGGGEQFNFGYTEFEVSFDILDKEVQ